MSQSLLRSLLLALPLLSLAACRAAPIVEPAGDLPLPVSWQGWSLYRSERAWVYAADERDADDAAKLVEEVAGDFRARTGREPSARLLVVADEGGWMPRNDPRLRVELLREGEATLGRVELDGHSDSAATEFTSWKALEKVARKLHVEPSVLLSMSFHPLALPRLSTDFGLPDELCTVRDAAVLLPTRALVAAATETTTDALLRKEVPLAVRLLAAPYMPFARRKAVNSVLAEQKALVFELFALGIPDWSAEERARHVEAYRGSIEDRTESELEPETPQFEGGGQDEMSRSSRSPRTAAGSG
jgi:hypothetical protein